MTDVSRRDHPVVVCAHGADSSGAVQLGAQLASALGERLVLASAFHYEPLGLSAAPLPSPVNEVRADAAVHQIERAERLVPRGVRVAERPLPVDRVSDGLVGLARELDACVLVLGRDLEGHVTRGVIHEAPCPIAVSPLTVALPQPEPLRRIAVAYDGSAASRCGLAVAAALASTAGESDVEALIADADDLDGLDTDLAADTPHEAGVRVVLRRIAGDPRRALVDESQAFDVLVCGSRGRGLVASAVLGSVSSELVRAARCPVIVVPPSARVRPHTPLGVTTAAA